MSQGMASGGLAIILEISGTINKMLTSTLLLQILLMLTALMLLVMAILYLCRRKMEWWEYPAWGLLALLPILGALLVISLHPGKPLTPRKTIKL